MIQISTFTSVGKSNYDKVMWGWRRTCGRVPTSESTPSIRSSCSNSSDCCFQRLAEIYFFNTSDWHHVIKRQARALFWGKESLFHIMRDTGKYRNSCCAAGCKTNALQISGSPSLMERRSQKESGMSV